MSFSPHIIRWLAVSLIAINGVATAVAQTTSDEVNHCDSLRAVLAQKRYTEAYRLAVVLDGQNCSGDEWKSLRAEALIRTGRIDEGLEIIEDVVTSKADSLRANVERMRLFNTTEHSHIAVLSTRSDTSVNELISRGLNGHLIILKGQERSVSEFPVKLSYDNLYRMEEPAASTAEDPMVSAFKGLPDKGVFQLGPACVLPNNNVLVTGESRGGLTKRSASGLTIFQVAAGKNEKPQIFDLAEPGHTYAHPTLSADGTVLILSSDRPGGYGGMDLWMSKLNDDSPSELINLGPAINSPYNEVFPVFNGDTLYFASDDHARSAGGYDVLRSAPPYGNTENPGPPLNTSFDDLCPVVTDGRLSHLVSNRASSLGRDNIFEVVPVRRNEMFDVIYGRIDSEALERGAEVHLVNADGDIVDRAYVDAEGGFSFTQIKGRETYEVVVPRDTLEAGDVLSIFDADKNLVNQVRSKGGKSFRFELLTPMDYMLNKEVNKDESVLTIDILGMMDNGEEQASGISIILQDKEGNVVGKTFTDTTGGFKFENVSPDSRYSIRTEVTNPDARIHIYNDRGELLKSIEPKMNGEYVYVRLSDEEKMITITNEERKRITISDKDIFNLPSIYYELDRAKLTSLSANTLDKLIEIMRDNPHISIKLSGHTDSRGAAEYNLNLSERRIQSVVDYLLEAGIELDRVEGKGFGESQLLNDCADGVECSEEEHAMNRRTEIRIIDKNP